MLFRCIFTESDLWAMKPGIVYTDQQWLSRAPGEESPLPAQPAELLFLLFLTGDAKGLNWEFSDWKAIAPLLS